MAGSRASTLLMGTTTVLSLSLAAYMSVRAQQPSRSPTVTAPVYPSLRGVNFDADHSGHVGGYEYVFARTPQGWRFRGMTIVSEVEERRA